MGRYQKLVGKLIYLTHTRFDITYIIGIMSQFMHAPNEKHMDAVYMILSILKVHLTKVNYTQKMVSQILKVILMQTGQEIKHLGGLCLVIRPLWKGI